MILGNGLAVHCLLHIDFAFGVDQMEEIELFARVIRLRRLSDSPIAGRVFSSYRRIGCWLRVARLIVAWTSNRRPATCQGQLALSLATLLVVGAYLGGHIVYHGGAGIASAILVPELRGRHHGAEEHGQSPSEPKLNRSHHHDEQHD